MKDVAAAILTGGREPGTLGPGGGRGRRSARFFRPARSNGYGVYAETVPFPRVRARGQALSDALEDRALIARAARGDAQAFAELVRRHQGWVRQLAFRYARQRQDAEELAQEVFLRAWRYAGSFRGEAAFATWLYRLAVNACLNFKAGRRARPETLPLSEALESGEPEVGAGLAAGEREARLREALALLPARQRLALVLASFEDKSYEEIAAAMGVSLSSVESLLFRARRRLAAALRPFRERGEM